MRVKLRLIKQSVEYPVYGVSIPKDIAIFFHGTEFTVTKSGTSIILTSGCSIVPTEDEVREYDYSDVRV